MSLSNYRELEGRSRTHTTALGEEQLLRQLLERKAEEDTALDKPFEFLYEDLIYRKLNFDFLTVLGVEAHSGASEDAETCLKLSVRFRELSPNHIGNWIQSALLAFDRPLLHYVQTIKGEVIKEPPNTQLGEDRWIYDHLVRKGDYVEKSVGESFDSVARRLNMLKHVKKIDRVTGRITIQPPNKKKIKHETGKWLKKGLDGLLQKYKQKCNA